MKPTNLRTSLIVSIAISRALSPPSRNTSSIWPVTFATILQVLMQIMQECNSVVNTWIFFQPLHFCSYWCEGVHQGRGHHLLQLHLIRAFLHQVSTNLTSKFSCLFDFFGSHLPVLDWYPSAPTGSPLDWPLPALTQDKTRALWSSRWRMLWPSPRSRQGNLWGRCKTLYPDQTSTFSSLGCVSCVTEQQLSRGESVQVGEKMICFGRNVGWTFASSPSPPDHFK